MNAESEHKVKRVPMHRQVADKLRTRILSGELQPGAMLPPMQRLATQFGTSYFTVQTALTALDAEGLVESRQRIGTVVRHNSAVLTCAGLYCGGRLLENHQFDFYRVLLRQLQDQLAASNVRTQIYLDSRPDEEHTQALPALRQAVERNEIQALIVVFCDHRCTPWLAELPITSAFVTTANLPNRVITSHRTMLQLALSQLKERGCRSVGLITSIDQTRANPNVPQDYLDFYADFASLSADLGLRLREKWVCAPVTDPIDKEREGYDQFHALWRQATRPDGILVYPDVAARGAMTAVLELGVRVPEDLKVVFHHNTEVDWTCPLPVDWVESDTAAWAAALIDLVRRQKAGVAVSETRLSMRLVGAGAGGMQQAGNGVR